jgi:hypothetical protein
MRVDKQKIKQRWRRKTRHKALEDDFLSLLQCFACWTSSPTLSEKEGGLIYKLAYLIVREWKLPFSIDELGSFNGCTASCRKLIGLWYFAQLSTPLYFSIEWPQRRLLPHFELGIFTQGHGGNCNLPKFI